MSGSSATANRSLDSERDELLRQGALDSLTSFAELVDPTYKASRMHELLATKLEACAEGKIRRLAISCPPRHGKSEKTSVKFPAWLMTKRKRVEIIQAGYSAMLSGRFSKKTKDVLKSTRYLKYFPEIVDPTANKVMEWRTTTGGSYLATGVGGSAVGMGADVLIVDDPIKNRKEANSKTYRDGIWNWFISTALTRLSPDGVVIVILTRWHEDDLIGRLTNADRVKELNDAGFSDMNFEVLNLEAICEKPESDPLHREMGEPLWPERWHLRALKSVKVVLGSYEWNAQYMGRPNPPEGELADLTKINYITRAEVPTDVVLGRAWDLAYSEEQQADFSAGAYGGVKKWRETIKDESGTEKRIERKKLYLVHMNRGKRKWPKQKAEIVACAERELVRVGMEAQSKWEPAFNEIKQALSGRVIVQSYTPNKDKVSRALLWLALIDSGDFYMVRGEGATNSGWIQDFLDELIQFPNGLHDDQVDAVSVLFEMSNSFKLVLA